MNKVSDIKNENSTTDGFSKLLNREKETNFVDRIDEKQGKDDTNWPQNDSCI